MATKRAAHKHKWGKKISGIFNGPVRLCMGGECGGIKFSDGKITNVKERKKREATHA